MVSNCRTNGIQLEETDEKYLGDHFLRVPTYDDMHRQSGSAWCNVDQRGNRARGR